MFKYSTGPIHFSQLESYQLFDYHCIVAAAPLHHTLKGGQLALSKFLKNIPFSYY